jgi:hypothetical protein
MECALGRERQIARLRSTSSDWHLEDLVFPVWQMNHHHLLETASETWQECRAQIPPDNYLTPASSP